MKVFLSTKLVLETLGTVKPSGFHLRIDYTTRMSSPECRATRWQPLVASIRFHVYISKEIDRFVATF